MTGWELPNPSEHLLPTSSELQSFLDSYALASINDEANMVAVIRRCDPGLNAPPEGDQQEAQLHFFGIGFWTRYPLPQSLTYLALDYEGRTLVFQTDEGEVRTNISQMGKLQGLSEEAQLRQAFLALQDVWPRPRPPIQATQLQSRVLGEMRPSQFEDWWAGNSLALPYFGHLKLPVTFTNLHPEEDPEFLEEADRALENFLKLGPEQRHTGTPRLLANCKEFLEMCGSDEQLAELEKLKDIWEWVTPTQLYVTRRARRDRALYIQVSCQCHWEEEHGLQLVFRRGG
jgi:hypothetical protein